MHLLNGQEVVLCHSITDVHAHYDEAVFDTDRGEVLRTAEAGVRRVNSGSACRPRRSGPGETVRGYMPV
ncbi:MAG: hypothetical protein ACLRRT_08670 [Ruthenibacterium lactatiformans]